jgi:hypothetical protein
MNTKKIILALGVAGTTYLVALTLLSTTHFCPGNQTCTGLFIQFSPWSLANYIFFTFPLFVLSLITYKMKDEVFRAWWNFARWWVPVIIAATFLLNNASGGGTLGMDKDFTAFILIILYSVLIVTSLVKIARAYLKTKGS